MLRFDVPIEEDIVTSSIVQKDRGMIVGRDAEEMRRSSASAPTSLVPILAERRFGLKHNIQDVVADRGSFLRFAAQAAAGGQLGLAQVISENLPI